MIPLLVLLLNTLLCVAAIADSAAAWTLTTEAAPWANAGSPAVTAAKGDSYDVVIDPERKYQRIDGFGGCFNEKGWEALSVLGPEKREEALKALFDPQNGARFNICRVPIGASDYALDRYTLNESKDDFQMEHFSIDRDRQNLIPFIKAAMKYRPDLRLHASAWTPPTWMKTNGAFDGGTMKDDPRVYDAYALYLQRFMEAYRKEGIDVYAVCVQNEPTIDVHYPSCLWTPAQFLTFIRDHVGPLFEKNAVQGEIWLATMQDADYQGYPKTVLDDPKANRYVAAVGYQWDGIYSVEKTRRDYPSKTIVQTETECGNWPWKPRFDPKKPQNDWRYGAYTWRKVKDYFKAGVNSYMLWNMVLDGVGMNMDIQRPWPQNAPLVVDTASKSLIYTPMYYAFKHWSAFVQPGAFLVDVKVNGSWNDVVAFKNPDGGIVVVLQNYTNAEIPLKIKFGEKAVALTLPAVSWSTVTLP